MTIESINKTIQNPLVTIVLISELMLLLLPHEHNFASGTIAQQLYSERSGGIDNVQAMILFENQLAQQDLRFDFSVKNWNSILGLGMEGVLSERNETNNLTKEQQPNQPQCETNLVGDFDCDGITDPCPVFACIQ